MNPNPINIAIPANSVGSINCVSHAAYQQKVTLTWDQGSVVFSGSGENVSMLTPDGSPSFHLPYRDDGYTISALFQYATSVNAPFFNANVNSPVITDSAPFLITEVTSEDSTDNDNNDTYLTIVAMTAQISNNAKSKQIPKVKDAVEGANSLMLHAKTYYNDPTIQGGDEHYIYINKPSDPQQQQELPINYSSTGWTLLSGGCFYQPSPLGGYLSVEAIVGNCDYPNFQNAKLMLSTTTSFWGSFPTGTMTVNWFAILSDCQYQVTKVTN